MRNMYIYVHTCAHLLTYYFHGLAPICTIQQLDQRIQINWHEGSYDTF
jgi:hypothetical protein